MASTTFHCLLFQGLACQASSDLFSSEEGQAVAYSDNATREQILTIVNAVWDDGLFITFALLPAPHSNVYRTDRCLETIQHAKKAPVLFVWMKAAMVKWPVTFCDDE
ncbi:hypothetical protein B0H14DRAFT_2631499 [Mycena olivaceomarginata]|nr:hypothetical protein B0H14DRAFT_2631499 [Mycena olivaceomarginata]